MERFFLQAEVSTVTERMAALRGEHDDGSRTGSFILSAVICIVVLGSALLLYRYISKKLSDGIRSRASDYDRAKLDRSVDEIMKEVDNALGVLLPGQEGWLYWSEGNKRRGLKVELTATEGRQIVVTTASGRSTPQGRCRLVIKNNTGRGQQFEVEVGVLNADKGVQLEAIMGEPLIEVKNRQRITVSLKGAAVIRDGQSDGEAFPVRIIDISQDGVGFLCDRPMAKGTSIRVKVVLDDRGEGATSNGEVTWSDAGTAGIHRIGVKLEGQSFDVDAVLSDFLRQQSQKRTAAPAPAKEPQLV